ncbi:MAG: efflux transporter outer membrane subunit [Verrucomicrobiaceae bacterium]|nr:efflux transporter outer membrane subunit [Verrucomicrobiaceae bacterium]
MKRSRILFLLLVSAAIVGCKVGPNYERPSLGEPSLFRFGGKKQARSLGDLDWRTVFKDQALRGLIEEALANNLDMKSAAARVLQAQANLASVRSRFLPSVGAGYDYNRTQVSTDLQLGNFNFPTVFDTEQNGVGLSLLQYEADFWGKVRRSSEAARARLVATEEGRRMVQVGLVAGVATAYITMREQDYELEIARRTLDARRKSLELISTRQKGGQSPLTDVRQAEVLVAEADAAMRTIEKQIALLENQLSFLAGRAPSGIRRGESFLAQNLVSSVPAGLPSELLNRRPDIRAAEQVLVAATADIGVAKAQLLPSFTLTAAAGLRSKTFSDLFNDPSKIWQIGPGVSVPVFAGGRLLAGIRGSKAARDEAEAEYRKVVLQGLREVSDALISRQKSAGVREAQGRVVKARQDALGLIRERYDNGAAAYLEVLYNDQELFGAELASARAKLDEYKATIELYRALGGGWDRTSAP